MGFFHGEYFPKPFRPEADGRKDSLAMAKSTKERADKAAQQTGAKVVEKLPFDLSVIESEGVFVNVDATGFGILDRKLDWATLGVTMPKTGSAVAIRPPTAGLIPDKYRLPILRPADRLAAAHRKYSYRFALTETVFESPAYRWVPWKAWPQFESEFAEIQKALGEAIAAVEKDYPTIVDEVSASYRRLAEESEIRLRSTGAVVPVGFADLVVAKMTELIPTPEELSEKLTVRYRVGVMMLGSEMLAEQKAAVVARAALSDAEVKVSLDRQKAFAEAAVAQAKLTADKDEIERKNRLKEIDYQLEMKTKERIRELKLQAAKERLAETMNPLVEGAQQLHAAIFEAATAIKESLAKNEHMPSASAKRAREMAKWFRLMNWQSDAQLETLLGELEVFANRPPSRTKRDNTPVDNVLKSIINICYADAKAFGESNRMASLEI